ncbi:hypothetical protein P154DRAFT_536055 [Amniculicola lignicola CBS 123094]|uniref:Uncharacterized protein n=1 Tax=Amniculicola lignicola CBS 123094 TaxID=1392246 RepID=A0A6A5WHU4_9PLEO|nr:hypothetical protein P154DRAFT_536055 [Amniculicola lignicola CBS 123094]
MAFTLGPYDIVFLLIAYRLSASPTVLTFNVKSVNVTAQQSALSTTITAIAFSIGFHILKSARVLVDQQPSSEHDQNVAGLHDYYQTQIRNLTRHFQQRSNEMNSMIDAEQEHAANQQTFLSNMLEDQLRVNDELSNKNAVLESRLRARRMNGGYAPISAPASPVKKTFMD